MVPTHPRIKTNLAPFRWDDERIRFGGFQSYLSRNVHSKDWSELIWDLCIMMDGNKNLDTIIDRVSKKYNIEKNFAMKFLEDMVKMGLIEDANADTLNFSEEELERYERNINFFRWIDLSNETNHWKLQDKLNNSRVTILGTGGVGSHIAVNLARMGVGYIRIVDGDSVELSNLNRQPLFDISSIGVQKVFAAKEQIKKINPNIHIDARDENIRYYDDIINLIDDVDLFFLCADEPRGILDRIVNRAAYAIKKPYIVAGYASTVVNFSTYIPGVTPCFECLLKWQLKNVNGWEESLKSEERFGIKHAVVAPIASLAGSLAALEAMYILIGFPPRSSDVFTQIDVYSNKMERFPREFWPECPVCSNPHVSLDCEESANEIRKE